MAEDQAFDEKAVRKRIRAHLENARTLPLEGRTLYAVGGGWRALAKLQMDATNYPLGVLHGFRMTPKAVRSVVKVCLDRDPATIARREAIVRRRAATAPYSAVLLDEIMAIGRFSDIVISASGLREGVVFDLLGRTGDDSLMDGVALSARLGPGQRLFGAALYDFVTPALDPGRDLFARADNQKRLVQAACLLADSGARLHPDHRQALAHDLVLRGGFTGVAHSERAFLALAVGSRYARRFNPPKALSGLLEPDEEYRARQLGACMRVGAVVSGRSASVLRALSLSRAAGRLVLRAPKALEDMVSEAVRRRLDQAASIMGLQAEVLLDDDLSPLN